MKEVVEKADLSKLPVLTHFEKDAGSYITSAIVSARSLDENIEMCARTIMPEFESMPPKKLIG